MEGFMPVVYGPAHASKVNYVPEHSTLQKAIAGKLPMGKFPHYIASLTQRTAHSKFVDPCPIVVSVLTCFACYMGPEVQIYDDMKSDRGVCLIVPELARFS
jgi:hypothetical protein